MVMNKIIKSPTAQEVSQDPFVLACVAFQQAKRQLSDLIGGGSVEKCDSVSQSVYDLANKAVKRRMTAPRRLRAGNRKAVADGERLPFRDCVVKAVSRRKTFTSEDVVNGLERLKLLPESENVRGYVSLTLSSNTDTFKRVSRGVYTLKKALALPSKKATKALPASTS